jgi:hypothetical protein
MPTNVFVSYDHNDQNQVNGFKALKQNPNHPLDFRDHSLHEPVADRSGNPIVFPPSDGRSQKVRDEIKAKFDRASKLVVLIGNNTHQSQWVDWEIRTFFDMKKPISGDSTWKRIRGMKLKGCDNAAMPQALYNDRSTQALLWNPEELDKWLDENPNG